MTKNGTRALERLRGGLVVSCQASAGDPLDDLGILTRIAASVLRGGAAGLRAEGAEPIAAFRTLTELPIIGITKAIDSDGFVFITPDFAAARSVADAGADVIALDCTRRRLQSAEPYPKLTERIHQELGLEVMADIATVEDAVLAEAAGADAVATTLFGYTAETAGAKEVSWQLVQELVARVRVPVIVEGHIVSPAEVRKAFELGAHAVVIGSAITRPETITARFAAALPNSSSAGGVR